ncbi:MAG: hypothetical protein INQ03_01555 [Candidatus Heimdallarchaeota archaeon]|nr:hypothetical protein [Candidatus Heimdallarchaeota archaeon]
MVEPFSLAAISGLSAIGGLVIGKLTKKEMKIEPEVDHNVEFIAVKEDVEPMMLLPYLEHGRSIFLNIQQLKGSTMFMEQLPFFATENNLKINKVSDYLLLITPLNQPIKIRQLVKDEPLPRRLDIDINGA